MTMAKVCEVCGRTEWDCANSSTWPPALACYRLGHDREKAALAQARKELDAAWAATGVASTVRGLTTLDDVVAVNRQNLVERSKEHDEAIRLLREYLDAWDRAAKTALPDRVSAFLAKHPAATGDTPSDAAQVCGASSVAPAVPWWEGLPNGGFSTSSGPSVSVDGGSTPSGPAPIPMVIQCPKCHAQHIDSPELRPPWLNAVGTPEGYLSDAEWEARLGRKPWLNPPHKSHLCHACGTIWRPADVPTTGVASVSRGSNDTWPATPEPAGRFEDEAEALLDEWQAASERRGMEESPMTICEVCGRTEWDCANSSTWPPQLACFRLGYWRERAARVKAEAERDEAIRLLRQARAWFDGGAPAHDVHRLCLDIDALTDKHPQPHPLGEWQRSDDGSPDLAQRLHAAIATAERRGLERAAHVADAYDGITAKDIAAHIRALVALAAEPEKKP